MVLQAVHFTSTAEQDESSALGLTPKSLVIPLGCTTSYLPCLESDPIPYQRVMTISVSF
jgi:hypothetical protein